MKFALVFALTFGRGDPRPPDRWFGPDKVKHFVTSAVVTGMGYGALRATSAGHGSSLIGASGAALALGIGKEMRDRRAYGLFSTRDLAWDLAGIGAGAVMVSHAER